MRLPRASGPSPSVRFATRAVPRVPRGLVSPLRAPPSARATPAAAGGPPPPATRARGPMASTVCHSGRAKAGGCTRHGGWVSNCSTGVRARVRGRACPAYGLLTNTAVARCWSSTVGRAARNGNPAGHSRTEQSAPGVAAVIRWAVIADTASGWRAAGAQRPSGRTPTRRRAPHTAPREPGPLPHLPRRARNA